MGGNEHKHTQLNCYAAVLIYVYLCSLRTVTLAVGILFRLGRVVGEWRVRGGGGWGWRGRHPTSLVWGMFAAGSGATQVDDSGPRGVSLWRLLVVMATGPARLSMARTHLIG